MISVEKKNDSSVKIHNRQVGIDVVTMTMPLILTLCYIIFNDVPWKFQLVTIRF